METRADLAMEKLRQCQDRIQLNPLNMDLYMEENKLSQEARLLEKAKFQFLRQKSLLGAKNHSRKHVCSDIIQQGTLVNEAQRDELTREFTKEEVKQALWAIDGNKSPGLDGYGSKFFKNCWGIVGEDVTKGILEYFQNGEMLRWVNDTTETCTADNHIRQQSAFVTGRTIVQNILICQDLMRLYNRKNATKSCLLKIDLRKAYDSVEWDFVEEMLYGLQFPYKFIKWIMGCKTTTQFVIAINGGLLMKWIATQDGFQFHPKCRSLGLNHLCFADDMLLFCKGEFGSIKLMLQGLLTLSEASGLTINAVASTGGKYALSKKSSHLDMMGTTGHQTKEVTQSKMDTNGEEELLINGHGGVRHGIE
ncbi:uncharacterized protein LOC125842962 [Solanum stenotomum]|uniref:uncharacterized protein LOC125842962 n=1 Tax=Solanum stenotomum TaxID=172797 RepID=UPI0020D07DE8|nr:uncharacterized protein LOC125842962 [Solanum stenotomum]